MTHQDLTIEYYNSNSSEYFERTAHINMEARYNEFLACFSRIKGLEAGAKFDGHTLLDLGCGSGRDSKAFSEMGFDVTSIDASIGMCKEAEKLLGHPVLCAKVEELESEKAFDAVWACASLVHVADEKQRDAIGAVIRALKDDGVFFATWKMGEGPRLEGGRYFFDYTEESLRERLTEFPELKIEKIWLTDDNLGRGNKWVNLLCRVVRL